MLIPGAKTPMVTNDMVKQMRPSSVIVDVAVDQGNYYQRAADRVTTRRDSCRRAPHAVAVKVGSSVRDPA